MSDNKNKLNILYHHRTQGRGAEGVHITSIVKALEAMGHSVTIVSPAGVDPMAEAGNAPVDKSEVKTSGVKSLWKFVSKNLPNFLFEFAEIGYNLVAMKALEKELKSGNYDLIYERYAFFMVAGAIKAKKYGIPLILEANEVSGIKDRARKQTFKRLCDKFERFLFKRCHSIHTVSSYLKNMIVKQGVTAENVLVTPNAIEPEKFKGSKEPGELVEKYGLNNKTVIGFAGWFDDWDRLDLLVEAFADLEKRYSDLVVLLIGDGAVLEDVRERAKTLGLEDKIILTGAVPRAEVQKYISLLDIAVITHSNEFGSPVVMFEFMGLKIPVVAPRLMPITDVLTHDETGLIFDVLDMNGMKDCISLLLDDSEKRKAIAESAYSKLMQEHTWESNAKDIVNPFINH
ncbi:glycosyltransferase family 4 protein [Aliikangiella sp. G2MR2-5]|uniref:glycosyltransferase family 4 protein n=1 Tax=Aliikangiella sp. G2MR2-5 TaxID=2788943 RepID=UPI0018AC5510|nr:glycosyltransferase family 4 protein [Aliikangiella sp. G2MR2-5]